MLDLFSMLDTDGAGEVTRAEWIRTATPLLGIEKLQAEQIFDALDQVPTSPCDCHPITMRSPSVITMRDRHLIATRSRRAAAGQGWQPRGRGDNLVQSGRGCRRAQVAGRRRLWHLRPAHLGIGRCQRRQGGLLPAAARQAARRSAVVRVAVVASWWPSGWSPDGPPEDRVMALLDASLRALRSTRPWHANDLLITS